MPGRFTTVTTGLLGRATRTPLPAPPHAYPIRLRSPHHGDPAQSAKITPHRRSPSSHPPRGSVVGNLPTVQPNHNPNQCLQNMARNGLH